VAASSSGLHLQILGPLRVWRDGVERDAGPRQQAYLLALLIARAGQPISREELIDLVWDDDAPASARFYGFNRPGSERSEAVIQNWFRQGMADAAKAQYDCVDAFADEDYTEDLKKITVPVLVMHGDDDQIVPYASTAPRTAELVQNGTLKTYAGFPHGMPTTQAETINADLLEFIRS
jgi:pimeloyl-ACP methyl ester carboxylesterase